jgi:peptidoglycan/LPS O-acetylase OafA/YrhL
MYHPLCIVLAILLVRQAGLRSDFVLYPVAVGLVIALSAVSYRFFESPFLKAKAGFTVIASGGTPNSG